MATRKAQTPEMGSGGHSTSPLSGAWSGQHDPSQLPKTRQGALQPTFPPSGETLGLELS